jgi:hypothetical protein
MGGAQLRRPDNESRTLTNVPIPAHRDVDDTELMDPVTWQPETPRIVQRPDDTAARQDESGLEDSRVPEQL